MENNLDKKSSIPLYQQLAELLKIKILEGEIRSGHLMPSENALAKEYSVSRMTARATLKLLEDEGFLSCNGTKGRIVEGGSEAIPHFSKNPEFVIGVYPFRDYYYDDIYYGEILDGVTEAALKNGVKLKFLLKDPVLPENFKLIELLYKEKIDALIRIRSNDFDLNEMMEIDRAGFKTIAFNADLTGSGANFITCDHYSGASMLLDCFCHMGHRKIACIMHNKVKFPCADESRWRAYRDALERYKLSFREEFLIEIGSYGIPGAVNKELDEKLEKLFCEKDRPSAIFVSRGGFLKKTIEKLSEMGFSVPGDVSVATFDDILLPESMPRVTCVKQPIEKMAGTAVDILCNKLKSPGNQNPLELKLDAEFIPGNSCAFFNSDGE